MLRTALRGSLAGMSSPRQPSLVACNFSGRLQARSCKGNNSGVNQQQAIRTASRRPDLLAGPKRPRSSHISALPEPSNSGPQLDNNNSSSSVNSSKAANNHDAKEEEETRAQGVRSDDVIRIGGQVPRPESSSSGKVAGSTGSAGGGSLCCHIASSAIGAAAGTAAVVAALGRGAAAVSTAAGSAAVAAGALGGAVAVELLVGGAREEDVETDRDVERGMEEAAERVVQKLRAARAEGGLHTAAGASHRRRPSSSDGS